MLVNVRVTHKEIVGRGKGILAAARHTLNLKRQTYSSVKHTQEFVSIRKPFN
jgi:hypothetical protein